MHCSCSAALSCYAQCAHLTPSQTLHTPEGEGQSPHFFGHGQPVRGGLLGRAHLRGLRDHRQEQDKLQWRYAGRQGSRGGSGWDSFLGGDITGSTGGHTPGEALQLHLPSFPQGRQETELEGHMIGHMKSHGAGIQIQICLVLTPILFPLRGRLCKRMSALGLQER